MSEMNQGQTKRSGGDATDTPHVAYDTFLSDQMNIIAGRGRRKKKLAWIDANYRRLLPASADARILEIGPGLGEALEYFREKGFNAYRAIDVSAEVVDHCNGLVPGSCTLCRDTEAFLAEHAGEFDLIVMFHVLEHTPKDRLIPFLRALHGALSAKGQLLLEVPNALNLVTGTYFFHGEITHVWAFTQGSLSQALRLGGFREFRIGGCRVPLTGPVRWGHYLVQAALNSVQVLLLRSYLPTLRPLVAHTMWALADK